MKFELLDNQDGRKQLLHAPPLAGTVSYYVSTVIVGRYYVTIPAHRMLRAIIATLVLLVPVYAQDFVLQPGQILPLTFAVAENETVSDQRISVTAGPGTDVSIRCTPTSVTNGTWFWESST